MPTNPLDLGQLNQRQDLPDQRSMQELIAWCRRLDERVRNLELLVNLDPEQPEQALGILIERPDET